MPDNNNIPHIIHFVWFGPLPVPEAIVESWKQYHPGFEVRIWTESTIFPLHNQKQFDETYRYNQKSDLARYEILLRYGGIYVDCDICCIRPITPLLSNMPKGKSLLCVWEKKNLISNSLIACNPGNPVMKQIVDNISIGFDVTKSVWRTTGPLYFMNELRSYPEDVVTQLGYYHFNLCHDFNLWEDDVLKFNPAMQDRNRNRDIRFNCIERPYTIHDCYGVQLWCGGRPSNYDTMCKRNSSDIVKNLKRYIRYMYMVRNQTDE
jgi:mannosyltransferase OCH1-like enzyme